MIFGKISKNVEKSFTVKMQKNRKKVELYPQKNFAPVEQVFFRL